LGAPADFTLNAYRRAGALHCKVGNKNEALSYLEKYAK
jgi:hypothetical protein